MRRLPIYFLIDISESMVPEQISIIESILVGLIKNLKQNPETIETACLSINNLCKNNSKLNDLLEVDSFKSFKLIGQKEKDFNHTLKLLNQDFESFRVKSMNIKKRDWRPIILFLINSNISHLHSDLIKEYKKNHTKTYIFLTDRNIDAELFYNISDDIFYLNEINISSFYSKLTCWDDEDNCPNSEKIEDNLTSLQNNLKKRY